MKAEGFLYLAADTGWLGDLAAPTPDCSALISSLLSAGGMTVAVTISVCSLGPSAGAQSKPVS